MGLVMVTGSSGLIGRHVVADYDGDVVAVDHREIDLLSGNAFTQLIHDLQPSSVLHLAWSASGVQGYRTHPDNARWIDVSLAAAAECRNMGIHFIATGTAVDDRAADDPYARSKQRLRESLAPDIDAGTTTWLRPFYVFDPVLRRPAVLAEIAVARDMGRPAELQAPHTRHDFVHVLDVASGIRTVLRDHLKGVVDLGSGTARPVSAFADALHVSWRQVESNPSVTSSDATANTGALSDRGWSPRHTNLFFGDTP